MSHELLKGKKGIIFGALNEDSIAWKVAEKAFDEGAEFTLSNTPISLKHSSLNHLGEKCNAKIIPADATKGSDLKNVFSQSMDILGGKVDFILHSIAMSPNIRKKKAYSDLDYGYFQKTLDISALSFHKVLQTAYKMDAINDWGSVVALSYMAAQRSVAGYTDMAEAKSILESIARSFGYYYGLEKKVRVNTVSQSPTSTTAGRGIGGFDKLLDYTDKMSPLGNASADECADYCITLFSDLTRKVTMQNLMHDGGFSNVGISEKVLEIYNINLED